MARFRNQIATLLTVNVGLLVAVPAWAGSWQTNAPFGASLKGDLYTPNTPAASAAIMVAIHYCGGNAGAAHSWFQSAADQNGFYIITPDAGKNCFDASLSRDASSDPGAVVQMVKWVITNKGADASRVFAAGYSSGGCMTNTLLAIFPDVFAGGAALPGFPAGLWPKGDAVCQKCGSSPGASDTGQKYADMATAVFSFSGTRPCSAQWVGGSDQYNFNGWLPVVASQFQILGNLSNGTAGTGAPSGWTRTEYKDSAGNVRLQTNLGAGIRHDLTGSNLNGQVVSFLGLDKPTGACGITSSGTGGTSGTGGASNAGGASNSGGNANAGGTKAAGGTVSTGGSKAGTGGGNTGAGGSTSATGGKAAGGKSSTSATSISADTGGSTSSTGGTKAAGGTKAGNTGGTSANKTNAETGGDSSASTTSAVEPTGGSSSESGTGGSSNSEAGSSSEDTGGGTAVSNTTAGASSNDAGCGCRTAGNNDENGALWPLGLLGVAVAALRRRKSKNA